MSDKVFWSTLTGMGGIILIGMSAGALAAIGLFLCMLSHHLESHGKTVPSNNERKDGEQ